MTAQPNDGRILPAVPRVGRGGQNRASSIPFPQTPPRQGLYLASCLFPLLQQASRAQILDKATEYIQYMRRKNHTHQQDIDDLKRQNALLEQQGEGWGWESQRN